MKNTLCRRFTMLLIPLCGFSPLWASHGHTDVELEMHNSTSSFSPGELIKGSTVAVVPTQAADGEKLANLARRLTDRTAGLESARAIHKMDPTYTVAPTILNRLVQRAKVLPERERVRTGWITTCDSQAQALDTLAALGTQARSVIPEIVKLTHRLCVHEHVVAALEQMGPPDAVQLDRIAGGLQDQDPETRQAAVEFLAKSKPNAETIRTLGRAMNDPSSGVRLAALQALEEIHPEGEGRLPLLTGYLQDPSPEIRTRALYMVGQLGPDAPTAIPVLQRALKDSDPAIALTAAKLLARVDPQNSALITTLIGFMQDKGSALAMQAAQLLDSLHIHEARVDAALEPYRSQQALWQRINKASSDVSPEKLAENARTLKVEHVRIASGIVQDQPMHVARSFPSTVGRLYCWNNVTLGTPPATLQYRWYRNGKLQHEEYLEVSEPQMRLWSSAAVRAGEWKVDILPSGSKEPLATALFTVTKRKP